MSRRFSTGIILGASSGIGLATCQTLVDSCDRLFIGSRNQPKVTFPEKVFFNSIDISDLQSINQWFQFIKESHSVDFIINSAGVGYYAPIEEGYEALWEKIYQTNFLGLVHLLSAIRMHFLDLKHFIHISSLAAYQMSKTPGNEIYSISKQGGQALLKDFRTRLRAEKNNMKVSSIAPGYVGNTGFGEHYFEHSPELHRDLYQNFPPLAASDVATIVKQTLLQPQQVEVSEIIIRPIAQPD